MWKAMCGQTVTLTQSLHFHHFQHLAWCQVPEQDVHGLAMLDTSYPGVFAFLVFPVLQHQHHANQVSKQFLAVVRSNLHVKPVMDLYHLHFRYGSAVHLIMNHALQNVN